MSFVSASFLNKLGKATRESLDGQNFGIVQVDDQGKVLLYNRYQSEFTGVDPQAAEGRSYFTQIAPCTNNRLFFGKFKEGIAAGELDENFKYTFTFKMRPTPVEIHLFREKTTETNWVFVKKVA